MPLFMYLSGYVYFLSNKDTPYLKLLGKKVRRLLVPYFIVSVIIILIKMLGQAVLDTDLKNPVDAGTFLKIFIGPAAAIHLWFVLALWWMFVTVALFKSRRSHIFLLAVAVLLHYLPSVFPQIAYPEIFCLNYFANYLIYFMLGVVLCESGVSLLKYPTAVSAAFAAFFLLNYIFGILPFANAYAGIFGMIGLSIIICRYAVKLIKPIQVISNASYTIFLLHSVFIGFIVSALKPFPQFLDPQGKWFACSAGCIIFLSIVCCIAVWYLLKRIRSSSTKRNR